MKSNSVKLHRILAASPEKVFKAFTDADAMAAWLPPYGFVCKVHSLDVKVGGSYKCPLRTSQLVAVILLVVNI